MKIIDTGFFVNLLLHTFPCLQRSGVVDIKRTIANVREDRGGMISQPNLYWLLHNVACTYALAIGAGPSPPSYMLPPTMDGKPR